MAAPLSMLRAGLTGGIASGKTTVAAFLVEMGAFVVDADEVTRMVMSPGGSAFERVVRRFGNGILTAEGQVDRAKLAQRVFGDRVEREALNAIVHPEVRAEAARRFALCAESGDAQIGVLDAALLVETGYYRELDRLIVLRCSVETQQRRLEHRERISTAAARERITAQAPLEQKLAVADYVIDTDVSLDETRRQAEEVYAALIRDHRELYGAEEPAEG
jgi:dephospho-CoA kinase